MSEARQIGSTEFQHNFGAALSEVRRGRPVIVTIHGRPEVAVIDIAEYEALLTDARHLAMLRENDRAARIAGEMQ